MSQEIESAIQRARGELAALEPLRAQVVAANQRDRLIGGAAAVGGLVLAFLVTSASGQAGLGALLPGGLGVIAALVFFSIAQGRAQRFRTEFKQTMMRKLLDAIQPGLRYNPASGIPKTMFRASRLFSESPDRYEVEDLVNGRVGATDLLFSEVHAQYKSTSTDSKGRTRTTYHTFFRGLFMSADFHKHFRGTLRIMPNRTSFLGALGRALSAFRPFSSEKLVQLEDPEFTRTFHVYGNDDIEARYILSPGMMQRILEVKRRWNDEIRLSFLDSSVCIAIQHRNNLFEPQLSRPADCQLQLQQIAGEIRICLDLVEQLNLNTRIWTKT